MTGRRLNWGAILLDITIVTCITILTIHFNNNWYLFGLILLTCTGEYLKERA